jgi:hypothetical protein
METNPYESPAETNAQGKRNELLRRIFWVLVGMLIYAPFIWAFYSLATEPRMNP